MMKFKPFVNESNKGIDVVKVTVPLFIKLMEWAREDAKSDIEVHKLTEKIISKNDTLCSEHFDELIKGIK